MVLLLRFVSPDAHAAPPATWRSGWYAQPPLQFAVAQDGTANLTGLDIEVMRAVAQAAGRQVQFEEIPWHEQQRAIARGERDVAFGAIQTPEANVFARFSAPYRRIEHALYIRVGDLERQAGASVTSFLALARAQQLRLGVIAGRPPVLPEVRAFVADPANASLIVAVETDAQCLAALAQGGVDAALTDRFVAATLTAQLGLATVVAEHPVRFGTAEVRVMFSRASTTEADVTSFNQALRTLQDTGAFDHLLHRYLMPPLLDIAIGGRWFTWLDFIGTAAFALSGLILARQGRYNLVGAFVLSALPAVGGGILRDIVIDRRPVGVLRSPTSLLIVVLLVLAGYVFLQIWDRLPRERRERSGKIGRVFTTLCGFFDTVGLAAFTITGVHAAVEAHCDPLPLWGSLLATLTGAGGGILRDIVRADFHNPTLKRGFYAEVALVWAFGLSLFLQSQARTMGVDEVRLGILLALIGTFATRFAILRRGWENPLQFGSRHTLPARQLAALQAESQAIGAAFADWFEERDGITQPRTPVEIEKLHNATLHRLAAIRAGRRELALAQPPPDVAAGTATLGREIDCLAAAEAALYDLAQEPPFAAEPACRLLEAVFASAATLCAALAEGAQSTEDQTTFLALTHDRGEALEKVRARFATTIEETTPAERTRMLRLTLRFERLVQLLHDTGHVRATLSLTAASREKTKNSKFS